MRHVSDDERRARLAVRQALAPAFRVDSPVTATRAMTALHATESATVYLSCWARVESLEVADVDRALYDDRSLMKQLAMRRTLFVFPRDLLPAVWPSASARVAGIERARMSKDVVRAGLADDGDDWLYQARAEVLKALAEAPDGLSATEVRQAVPMIDVKVAVSGGEIWSAPRVLTHLSATADIVRGAATGRFPIARPRWTLTRHWLDDIPAPWDAADGYRELVRRWLRTFGPGTEDDIVWWLGATKTVVRAALAALDAVAVDARSGRHRLAAARRPRRSARPRLMGGAASRARSRPSWAGRGATSTSARIATYSSTAAATPAPPPGSTAGWWAAGSRTTPAWCGCGCWNELRHAPGAPSTPRRARLTGWLDGVRVGTIYRSPAMKSAPITA